MALKAGAVHTLALRADGTVFAWGDNYYGTLGVSGIAGSAVPIEITALTNVHTIAAGSGHSFAIKNDGTLWAWGYSHWDSNTGQEIWSATPALVAGLQNVVDVAPGYEHVLAVTADGSVWSWGSNWSHQLGTAAPTWAFQTTAVQVPNLSNVVKLAAADEQSFALKADGTL